jgi:hypothetical protein
VGRGRGRRLLADRGGDLDDFGDRGQVGGIEAVPFGVLIFVVGALLCANAWAVVDAKMAVDAAAREATRAYVESQGTSADAVAAGRDAMAAHGRDPGRAEIWLSDMTAGGFQRCARATFSVSYEVPALTLPWIGGYGDAFTVTSHHSELVDPYRNGVPGDATSC